MHMRSWSINRVCALALGIIFLILGLIGFVTPTENSSGVQAIFGIFDSDTIHNVFYVIVGLLGIASSFTGQFRTFNKVFGVVFILLALLGVIPALYFPAGSYGHDNGLFLGITHMNAGDHILHLIAGLIAAVVGFFLVGSAAHPERKARARQHA
jgi:heme/copper-type cytochrome/quinol oxidase subunit 3